MTHNESTTPNFKQSYAVLQRNANTLRQQAQTQQPNIDDLLAIVQESMDAYEVCRNRIDAVEKALQQTLGQSPAEPSGEGTVREVQVSLTTKAAASQPVNPDVNPENFAVSAPELEVPRVSRAERFATQPR